MKKREFLAMGGAVPLVLAGCGGKGAGSAPVRLVNASVGYSTGLGFMVNANQAVTGINYGIGSPYETVDAGSVPVAITQTTTVGSVSSTVSLTQTTRPLNKDSRYTLVAYGYVDELSSVLITENTNTPDSGYVYINVLNTSIDVGAVDVYLVASGATVSQATRLATNTNPSSTGIIQTAYVPVSTGSYSIVVAGTGTPLTGANSDIRLISSLTAPVPFTQNQASYTIVLTPAGLSGTLANAIVVQQNSTATTAVTPLLNTTARVRAVVSATANASTTHSVVVTGTSATTGSSGPVTILSTTVPNLSDYVSVLSGTLPTVTVDGATLTPSLPADVTTGLAAGGDYTLLVYLATGGVPTAQLLPVDDNTAPATSGNIKVRLINLVYDSGDTLPLSLLVNAQNVASNIGFAATPVYREITPSSSLNGTIQVRTSASPLISQSQPLTANKIYTDFVLGYTDSSADAVAYGTAIANGTATSNNTSISNVFEASSTSN